MFILQYLNDPIYLLFWATCIVLGITVHEAAHCWTSTKLGDPTPGLAGRVTLDPLAHLDPLGTLLIFLIGFGWGKPSPFNPTYFKHYKRDTATVAIAGPTSNILFLLAAALLLKISVTFGLPSLWDRFLAVAIEANLLLAVFNLIPIPPLDGSKLIYAILPDKYDETFHRLETLGPLLILGLFLFGSALIMPIYTQLLDFIVRIFGL